MRVLSQTWDIYPNICRTKRAENERAALAAIFHINLSASVRVRIHGAAKADRKEAMAQMGLFIFYTIWYNEGWMRLHPKF